jgi:hypothetical protein
MARTREALTEEGIVEPERHWLDDALKVYQWGLEILSDGRVRTVDTSDGMVMVRVDHA